jgi:pantothenate kinase type III
LEYWTTAPQSSFERFYYVIILFDIGNTNTHLGLADDRRVIKQTNVPTIGWFDGTAVRKVAAFAGRARIEGAALCSVVPRATPHATRVSRNLWHVVCLELTPKTLRGVGIDYPKPKSIGADRLAFFAVSQPVAAGIHQTAILDYCQ